MHMIAAEQVWGVLLAHINDFGPQDPAPICRVGRPHPMLEVELSDHNHFLRQ